MHDVTPSHQMICYRCSAGMQHGLGLLTYGARAGPLTALPTWPSLTEHTHRKQFHPEQADHQTFAVRTLTIQFCRFWFHTGKEAY